MLQFPYHNSSERSLLCSLRFSKLYAPKIAWLHYSEKSCPEQGLSLMYLSQHLVLYPLMLSSCNVSLPSPSPYACTHLTCILLVFIQLHRRATLLNGEFQKRVFDIVAHHAANLADSDKAYEPDPPVELIPEKPGMCTRDQPGAESFHLPAAARFAETGCPRDRSNYFSRPPSLGTIRTVQQFVTATIVQARRGVVDPPALGDSGSLRPVPRPSVPGRHKASAEEDLGPILDPCLTGGSFGAPLRLPSATHSEFEVPSESSSGVFMIPCVPCQFRGGVFPVWVAPAQSKKFPRMTEKVQEYVKAGADWPRTACILDPVRASIVCHGAAQIIEVAEWFLSASALQNFSVCRVKNKFALSSSELVGACRVFLFEHFPSSDSLKVCCLLEVWH